MFKKIDIAAPIQNSFEHILNRSIDNKIIFTTNSYMEISDKIFRERKILIHPH